MKILIADFEISKYGGIIEHVTAKVKALKKMGHEVDIAQLSASSTTQTKYQQKVKRMESGSFQSKLKDNSQNGGYEKDEATGYWKNNYYGFHLPPSNRIGVFEKNALERWHKLLEGVDLIMWNFMPTKSSVWGDNFNFWHKFYDLPSDEISQIFIVHDAYFDVRASNVTALKDKILFLECAHIAAYKCCENIGIPRTLLLNPRFFDEGQKMPKVSMNKRKTDFFAAHIFKSMKHVDDFIRAISHLEGEYINKVAGSGIEQAYMVAPKKCKATYKVSKKKDPDAKDSDVGRKIWDVAVEHGMEYLGQISSDDVNLELQNTKFAIDPSWAQHYSNYCRTHINGFIIEAMLNGAYPVVRDYKGLIKDQKQDPYDPLFEAINSIVIPWDATPKEFAQALKKASSMSPEKFRKDTEENYRLVMELFNAETNMEEVIRLVKGGKKLVNKELEIGKDSENVSRIASEIMEDFFHIKLPIEWETE